MQFIVISHQLKIILFAVIFGCIFGIIYDIIFLIRTLCVPCNPECVEKPFWGMVFIHILDLLYMIIATASYCIFVYYFNSGHFRWYLTFSILIGLFCYKKGPGILVRFLLNKVVIILRFMFKIVVLKPISLFLELFIIVFRPVISLRDYCLGYIYTQSLKRKIIKDNFV